MTNEIVPTDDELPVHVGADLPEKQRKFLDAYLVILAEEGVMTTEKDRITRAALLAGYSEKSAYNIGWRNMRSPRFRHAIGSMSMSSLLAAHLVAVEQLTHIAENGTDVNKLAAIREIFDRGALIRKTEVHHTHEEVDKPGRAEMIAQMRAMMAQLAPRLLGGPVLEGEFKQVHEVPVKPSPVAKGRLEAVGEQPEASKRRLRSAKGVNYVLKAQDPRLPRVGRRPKDRLTPGKELGVEEAKKLYGVRVKEMKAEADFAEIVSTF